MEHRIKIRRHDLVGSIEAAYNFEADEAAWMQGLLESVHPALDQGCGMLGYFYDFSGKDLRLWGPAGVGVAPEIIQGLMPLLSTLKLSEMRLMMLQSSRVMASASEILSSEAVSNYTANSPLGAYGIADTVGIKCHEPEGWGAMIGIGVSRHTRVDPKVENPWARFAAHVTTAMRMRRRLQAHAEDAPDAVLNSSGAVSHAETAAKSTQARELLTHAVQSRESARGALRRTDPEEASLLWEALVDGRWSLVDQHDADGRRWILARKNAPAVHEMHPLTLREQQVLAYVALGHSNKLVAYTLGLTVAAVGNLVARTARKLGAKTRVELIEQFNQHGNQSGDGESDKS